MVIRTSTAASVTIQFEQLSRQWKDECAILSSTSAMVAHPAYQAIIALGEPVVPLLLQDLANEHVHWFEALKSITGEDPVSPKDWGSIPAMTNSWLNWGRSRGLI